MKNAKKILIISGIVCVGIVIAMLLGGWLFEFKFWKIPWSCLFATAITFAVGISFTLNALTYFDKNRIVSIISMSVTTISVILFTIYYLSGFKFDGGYFKAIGIVAILAVTFNTVVSSGVKLKKSFISVQIISSVLLSFISVTLILAILKVNLFKYDNFLKFFVAIALVEIGLMLAIGIIAKKSAQSSENVDSVQAEKKIEKTNYVKISIKEYDKLKSRIAELETEVESLKNDKQI